MSKNTQPITYRYNVEGTGVSITRRHIGEAYPRNGNVGNPTQYFAWEWITDEGKSGNGSSRADAYERARASVLGIPYIFHEPTRRYVNVRSYLVVADEMKANYKGRVSR